MAKKINKLSQKNGIAWHKGQLLDRTVFAGHVAKVRENILSNTECNINSEPASKVLNLCADRYHFLVVFVASMLEGLVTVMPSNRSEGELARMIEGNKGIQSISDVNIDEICQHKIGNVNNVIQWDSQLIPPRKVVAELYTSGSTGSPRANLKTWGQLINGAQQICERFGLNDSRPSIIATVPPQHMFGFEMSIVLPLVCGVVIHYEQPFYPLDIQRALTEMPKPRVLVTTPLHLKACVTAKKGWPDIEFVMSATAPMPENVALQAEDVMNTQVKEVYGCSEAGAIATRRMVNNKSWELLPDFNLTIENGNAQLQILSSHQQIALPDKLESKDEGCFQLVGRTSDFIKIGGKRGSITEIATRLKAIKGVEDAVVFSPDDEGNHRVRLAALVVAPGMNSEDLRDVLVNEIDPVFMPRPLCVVPALPYDGVGKLPRATLLDSLEKYIKEYHS